MAQYSDIIAGLTVGSYTGQVPPSEFTSAWDGPFTTQRLNVFEDPTTPSGKALNVNLQNLSSRTFWRLNAISQALDPDAGTSTSLMIIRPKNTTVGAVGSTFGGVATRCTGNGSSETGAIANYARDGSGNSILRASTYTAGSSSFDQSTETGMWTQNEAFAMTIAVSGTTMTITSYPVNDIFGTPTAQVTRSCPASNSNNWHGIFAFGAETDFDVLYYSIGTGADMPPLPPVVVDPPTTAPGNPIANGDSSSTITLSYDVVSGATGYEYELDGGTVVNVGNNLTPQVTDLTASTEYDFRVRAYNSAGAGPWSAIFTGTTLAAGVSIVLVTDIGASNVSSTLSSIENPESLNPTLNIAFRPAAITGSNGTGWNIGFFAVDDAENKEPLFKLDRSTLSEPTVTPAAEFIPSMTQDFITFTQATGRTLVGGSTGTIEFSFAEPLPAGRVYIMTHPIGQQGHADLYAAALLANYTGICSPTTSANSSGVYYTSVAEVDENDRQIGGHSCYALKFEFGGATTDGGPKRKLIMTSGIHAQGEQQCWISFKACLDYILNSTDPEAVRNRADFDIYCYFNIIPNGIFGGHRRHNFRNSIDANRDFVNLALPEIQALTAAILTDTGGSADCCFDWHGARSQTSNFYILTPETPAAIRFKELGEPIFGVAPNTGWSTATGTYNEWATDSLGATFTASCELQGRGDTSVENYIFIGEAWAKTLAAADADGMFYTPPASVESAVTVNWPLFNVEVSQQSELPENISSVSVEWPLFSVAVQQSQELPGGSASVAISWPLPGFAVSQESTVPDFTSSIAVSWPVFGVSISQENQQAGNDVEIEFSWPMFSVSVSQESNIPELESDIAITWPMFSVSILAGQFEYFASTKARVDIPSLSRRVDI